MYRSFCTTTSTYLIIDLLNFLVLLRHEVENTSHSTPHNIVGYSPAVETRMSVVHRKSCIKYGAFKY